MISRAPRSVHMLLAAVTLGALGTVISTTDLRSRLLAGIGELDRGDPLLLACAVVAFACTLGCCGLAWHAGLTAAGVAASRRDAGSRYVVGSLVNSLVPLRAGGVVRLALYVRVAGVRKVGGVAAAIGSVRAAALAALVGVASMAAPIPRWPAGVLALAAVGVAIVACVVVRVPINVVAAWVCGATVARIAGATCVAAAFGAPHPLIMGPAIVAAIELAGTLPLTPGNLGLSTAAVAFVLTASGLPGDVALAAGIALAAAETATSIVLGLAGVAHLAGIWSFRPRRRFGRRLPVPATVPAVVAAEAG